jgi:hypothetical protein
LFEAAGAALGAAEALVGGAALGATELEGAADAVVVVSGACAGGAVEPHATRNKNAVKRRPMTIS